MQTSLRLDPVPPLLFVRCDQRSEVAVDYDSIA